MCQASLLRTFLTLTCLPLVFIANGDPACLRRYSGIYLTQNKQQVTQLTFYSSDGTMVSIDSHEKGGSPTIKGRNDRAGQWKCSGSDKPFIATQSVQVEESKRATDPLVTRLYETETRCSNNKRTNCSDIVQYRNMNITISTQPPEQFYSFSSTIHSSTSWSLLLHYNRYAHQQQQARQCLDKKSGLYMIEYREESREVGINKTYGLLLLKSDGFFSLINSNEREHGTHKFGTTLGRWKCNGDQIFATGNYFIYYPKRKLGEVVFRIDQCSSPLTQACKGYAKSHQYPLQFHQRPFEEGTGQSKRTITMLQYLSATQTKNKTCYKKFAGTYFALVGQANDTNGPEVLSGVYRTTQLFRDGRAVGNGIAEILTDQSIGNFIGYWTCNEVNSSSTHINIHRVAFYYDTNGGPNQVAVTQDLTCDNKLKNCAGEGTGTYYYSQLPNNGQFHDAVATYQTKSTLYFYANLPPY